MRAYLFTERTQEAPFPTGMIKKININNDKDRFSRVQQTIVRLGLACDLYPDIIQYVSKY